MILSINFANKKYKNSQKLNTFSARYFAKAEKVISYTPKDIDQKFRNEHNHLLSNPRGSGLWLWKPYFINKSLELLQEGDYLVYTDSGIFYYKNIAQLIEQLEASGQDIMLFDLPLLEVQWTRKSVFEAIDINIEGVEYSNQRNGAIIIIKKTDQSVNFVENWLNLCTQPNLLPPPLQPFDNEHFLFIEHREDQSILSLLSKKWCIKSFSDPSDFGKLPYLYLAKSKLVSVPDYISKFKIIPTYFLHHRGANILVYYIKFLFRYSLMKFIDPETRKL